MKEDINLLSKKNTCGNFALKNDSGQVNYGSNNNQVQQNSLSFFFNRNDFDKKEQSENPHLLLSSIEAYNRMCLCKKYDEAVRFMSEKKLNNQLDAKGYYAILIDLLSKLLPDDHFGNEMLVGKTNHGEILGILGDMYSNLDYPKEAISHYIKAYEIAKENGNEREEATNLGSMGKPYYQLGETEKAIECYIKALEISKKIENRLGEEHWLGNLGNVHRFQGNAKKAIEYYEQALKIAREENDRIGKGSQLANLGITYIELGETKLRIDFLKEALDIGKDTKNVRIINFFENILKEYEKHNK